MKYTAEMVKEIEFLNGRISHLVEIGRQDSDECENKVRRVNLLNYRVSGRKGVAWRATAGYVTATKGKACASVYVGPHSTSKRIGCAVLLAGAKLSLAEHKARV